MIHTDGTLRTEYWDNTAYWTKIRAGQTHAVQPNTTFNPQQGVGWYDLIGRQTVAKGIGPQALSPHFFHWQMSGMADAAKIVQNEGGIYETIYNFGVEAAAYTISLDPNAHMFDNAALNSYGYPVRGLATFCDGVLSGEAINPLDICQGGTAEWYTYARPAGGAPDMTNLAYTAQHLDVLLGTLSWQNLPVQFETNALNYYYAFQATTSKDADSYLDTANGGFKRQTIEKYFPSRLGSCNAAGFDFYTAPSGRIVNASGETAAELLSTLTPAFAYIIGRNDQSKAQELLLLTDQALNALISSPLTPQEGNCTPAVWGSQRSAYNRNAWQFVNLVTGYYLFKQTAVPAFPKACDLNAHMSITENDIKTELSSYISFGPTCDKKEKHTSLTLAKVVVEKSKPKPAPVALSLPVIPTAILPDGIRWGSWLQVNLLTAGFPPEALPLSTREVFKAPTGQWFDSISKGFKYWNKVSTDYNNLGPWQPTGGGDYTSAGYPAELLPFDERTIFQTFDGRFVETLSRGQFSSYRYIPTWFNPETWLPTFDLIAAGVPPTAVPIEARSVVRSDTNLLLDLIVKDDMLWYRSFNQNFRPSSWYPVKLNAYGFPTAASSDIDTLVTYKEPSGRWAQSITKGTEAWIRFSQ